MVGSKKIIRVVGSKKIITSGNTVVALTDH